LSIIKTTEPFLLPGNHTGVLLVHGFTGTPKEMRWMGEYLNRQGYTCLGIRLFGHATTPEDMIRSRWTDWANSVEDGYHLLSSMTEKKFIVGLSLGGVLSLLMSTKLDVAGTVVMSTPYSLPRDPRNYPIWFIKLASNFKKYMPKIHETPGATWHDKTGFEGHISYQRNPVRSIAEVKALLSEMQKSLPEVRKPVLLIHSEEDHYVLPKNMEEIFAKLVNVSDKTKVYLTGSGHVVTRDAARRQVFELARDFIRRCE